MSQSLRPNRVRQRQEEQQTAEKRKELASLVRAGQFRVTDLKGVAHVLQLLDLQDMSDLEEFRGTPGKAPGIIRSATFLLWLMLRREGLKDEEIDRGEWRFTESQVARMFTVEDLKGSEIQDSIQAVLKASGLDASEVDPRLAAPLGGNGT